MWVFPDWICYIGVIVVVYKYNPYLSYNWIWKTYWLDLTMSRWMPHTMARAPNLTLYSLVQFVSVHFLFQWFKFFVLNRSLHLLLYFPIFAFSTSIIDTNILWEPIYTTVAVGCVSFTELVGDLSLYVYISQWEKIIQAK